MRADDHPSDPARSEARAQAPTPEPVYCTLGDTLCRVHVWTEEEWGRLDPARRPAEAVFVPGLGWVAPVPSSGPG